MATSSATNEDHKDQNDERFECNICFEQAKDAVVSMCGHLFCWPCIHRTLAHSRPQESGTKTKVKWMEARSTPPTCPVCKSVIDKERLIPLYGRGSADKTDPRDKVPPRPQGQREEPPQQNEEGFGLDGIHLSFGIGAFPFTMLGGPMFQVFGNGPQRGAQRPANQQVREEEQRLAQIFITIAVLVVIVILFA